MNEAVARGLVFGRDIVFTYGPYAAVFTRLYHPATDALAMGAGIVLGLAYALALLTAMPKASGPRLLALILAFGLLLLARDTLLQCYALVAGLALARWLEPAAGPPRAPLLRVLLVMAPIGLLALTKGSAGILGAAVALLAAPLLWWRGHRAAALAALLAPLGGLLLAGWLIGQPAAAVPDYLAGLWAISSGYTEAMAFGGKAGHVLAYLLAAAAIGWLLWRSLAGQGLRRGYLTALYALSLFMAFKGGFVRNDSHAAMAAYLLPMALVLLPARPPWRAWAPALLLSLLCWCVIVYQYISHRPQQVAWRSVIETYTSAAQGLALRWSDAGAIRAQYDSRKAALRVLAALPRVPGPVDIYPVNQTEVLAADLNWSPRPVMQSYSAYTPGLAELNRRHLLGPRAPQQVFFAVDAIDERLPALEDGPSWPLLLGAYRPVAVHEGRLQLQRQAGAATAAEFAGPARAIEGQLGVPLPLPASELPLFARIDLQPTLLGRLLALLYKPPMLLIETQTAGGKTAQWRLVSGMARAGFVLSPLVERTSDFVRLYAEPARSSHQRVSRITIAPRRGAGWLWQRGYRVQLVPLPPPAAPLDERLLGVSPGPVTMPDGVQQAQAADCDGSIDRINRSHPMPTWALARAPLEVEGWLTAGVKDAAPVGQAFLMVSDADGKRRFLPLHKRQRDDIARHFGRPELGAGGFHGDVDVSSLAGQVWLGLALQRGPELRLCRHISIPFEFKQSP
jgi:hypothetical protein